ncbi:MAG: late competence development ComFB family protein [Spirochaetia bacterium]|nr:late competence development ComFB family protein [Spirochaetia bacterium]
MEIRNLMEDVVRQAVDELFDAEEKKRALGFCTCYQCRLDVACYALNRTRPEYVISSRGVAHRDSVYVDKLQKQADVMTLVREGWERINASKRPHFEHAAGSGAPAPIAGPAWNFPAIIGRLFNGSNFEPLAEVPIRLDGEDGPVRMVDPNWQNPCRIVGGTSGTFIFYPAPSKAEGAGARKTFRFSLEASIEGFEPLAHHFDLELVSDSSAVEALSMQRVHKIPDLYLFPK